jgi:hypothetical protein
MIAVLPVLLYPAAGFGVMQLAVGFLKQQSVVGVQGSQYLPPLTPRCTAFSPVPAAAWLTLAPGAAGVPLAGVERAASAAALAQARQTDPRQDYPPLFLGQAGRLGFPTLYLPPQVKPDTLTVRPCGEPPSPSDPADFLADCDRTPLNDRQVDLLLVVPPDFREQLEKGGRPALYVLARDKDDHSRLVNGRVTLVLNRWKKQLKDVRLLRRGLPADYDEPFEVRDAEEARPVSKKAADELFETLIRVFPFILVMWSLAGALYPAVDLCAGEKERGTMETSLVSPASREEIVWGKFLTIWVFSAATALLNLLSMGLTAWALRWAIEQFQDRRGRPAGDRAAHLRGRRPGGPPGAPRPARPRARGAGEGQPRRLPPRPGARPGRPSVEPVRVVCRARPGVIS